MARSPVSMSDKRVGTSQVAIDVLSSSVDEPFEVIGKLLRCKDSDDLTARLANEDHSALLGIVACVMDKFDLMEDDLAMMAHRPIKFMRMLDKMAAQPKAVPATPEHYGMQAAPAPAPQPAPQPVQPAQPMPVPAPQPVQPHPMAHPYQQPMGIYPYAQQPQFGGGGGAQPLNQPRWTAHGGDIYGRLHEFPSSPPLPSQPVPRWVDPTLQAFAPMGGAQPMHPQMAAQHPQMVQVKSQVREVGGVGPSPAQDDSDHFEQ